MLPAVCIYVLCVGLIASSDCFYTQLKQISFYKTVFYCELRTESLNVIDVTLSFKAHFLCGTISELGPRTPCCEVCRSHTIRHTHPSVAPLRTQHISNTIDEHPCS